MTYFSQFAVTLSNNRPPGNRPIDIPYKFKGVYPILGDKIHSVVVDNYYVTLLSNFDYSMHCVENDKSFEDIGIELPNTFSSFFPSYAYKAP